MKSRVIKLADFDGFVIDPARCVVEIPSEVVDERINAMALNLGREVSVDAAADNCCIICETDGGRRVNLYPSLGFFGLDDACDKAAKASKGETFTAQINGADVSLTVIDIKINQAAAVDDTLAELAGIEGVNTLDELKAYVLAEEECTARGYIVKDLVREYMDYIIENSEAEIDEAEEQDMVNGLVELQMADAQMMGAPLMFDESGMPLDEDAAREMMKEDLKGQFKASLVMKAVCEADGYVPDLSMIREMMMIPDEMELEGAEADAMLENAQSMYVYDKIQQRVMEVMA